MIGSKVAEGGGNQLHQKWYVYVIIIWEFCILVLVLYKIMKILVKTRRLVLQGSTVREAISLTKNEILDSPILQFVRTEFLIYYYAMFKWRNLHESGGDSREFTYHKKSLYFSFYLIMLHEQIIEGIVLHFVLISYPIWDWISSGLHLYSIIWMTGDYNAIRWSRVKVDDDNICVKIGLRKSIVIPLCAIEYFRSVDRSKGKIKRSKDKFVSAAMPTLDFETGFGDQPQFEIALKHTVYSSGLFGVKNAINSVFIYVDDPSSFQRTVQSYLVT